MGVEDCRPADRTGQRVAPRELQRWLDEGRDVTLLDTRNDYEVRMGAFKGECRSFERVSESQNACLTACLPTCADWLAGCAVLCGLTG